MRRGFREVERKIEDRKLVRTERTALAYDETDKDFLAKFQADLRMLDCEAEED